MDRFAKCVVTYVIIAVMTFGYAAERGQGCSFDAIFCNSTERKALGGVIAAFFWPAYWSWEFTSLIGVGPEGGAK